MARARFKDRQTPFSWKEAIRPLPYFGDVLTMTEPSGNTDEKRPGDVPPSRAKNRQNFVLNDCFPQSDGNEKTGGFQ